MACELMLSTCKRHLILSAGTTRTAEHTPENIPEVTFWKLLFDKSITKTKIKPMINKCEIISSDRIDHLQG